MVFLCESSGLPTFAFALILHLQIRVPFAFGFQQGTFISVRFPVRAAHRPLPGDVGAVWGADAARLTPPVHFTFLPRAAVHVITCL